MSQPGALAPYALAMIICDAVHMDPTTAKRTILGTFTALGARSFPVRQQTLAVYFSLTDYQGEATIGLRLVDVDGEELLFEMEARLPFKDRRVVMESHTQLNNVVFPRPGEYRFQLSANGEFLLERRLMVVQLEGEE
jgi:hypothetical protein